MVNLPPSGTNTETPAAASGQNRRLAARERIYNIGVVAEMTGISRDTLRAWEKRHGFPDASRTEGGHRLYSEHDILRLQWVKAAVDAGMRSSVAITALQRAEEQGTFPEPPLEAAMPASRDTDVSYSRHPEFEQIWLEIFQLLLAADGAKANLLLSQALANYTLQEVISEVISPIWEAIGNAWADGQISIANEHYASQYLRDQLLHWAQSSVAPLPVRPIILACAPGDQHDGSLLMLNVLLRQMRWPVIYMGQMVPLEDLAQFAEDHQPSAIVLVATMEEAAIALQGLRRWFPESDDKNEPLVCFGGRIFTIDSALVEQTPGIYLGDSLPKGVERLDEMLRTQHL